MRCRTSGRTTSRSTPTTSRSSDPSSVAVRLIALFSQPEDPPAFDAHYRETHAPIVRRYPALRELRITNVEPMGPRSAPYYLMAEMVFDSRPLLDAALASEA